MDFLLDTCTFLWLATGGSELSKQAIAFINEPANKLYLSDVSIWEIVLKQSAGKLPLPETPRLWISGQTAFFQLDGLRIEPAAILLNGELPETHRDPFDRLLAAQSIHHQLPIITPDSPIADLGANTYW